MLHVTRVCRQLRFIVPLASSMLLAVHAWAQSMQPQVGQPLPPQAVPAQIFPPANQAQPGLPRPTPAPQASAPQPEASSNPGLIEEFGKLLKNSASSLSSTWKGSQQTIDSINSSAQDAAKGATDAWRSSTSQTMVKGRTTCPVAGNGAPDCKSASDQLCKAKGYKTGSSLDIETAETCNPKIYISGRTGAPGECKTENFVTRAVCQ